MKNKIAILVLFFANFCISQNNSGYEDGFIQTFITFNDGSEKDGYIYGFNPKDDFEIDLAGDEAIFQVANIERQLNYKTKKFKFKRFIGDTAIEITQNDFNEIKLFKDNKLIEHSRLLYISAFDEKGNLINTNRRSWLPIYKNDSITICLLNLWSKNEITEIEESILPIIYLTNSKNNYAFNTIDVENISLFNFGKIDDKIDFVLKKIFEEKPGFILKNLNSDSKWNTKSDYYKFEEYNDLKKKIKNDSSLNKKEKKKKLQELEIQSYINPYVKMIDAYNKYIVEKN